MPFRINKKLLSHSGLLTLGEVLDLSRVDPRFAYNNIKDKLLGAHKALFPRHIYLHLTDRCNFSCPMCSFTAARRAHLDSGFSEMPISYIQKMAQEARHNRAMIYFHGGEPLLYKYFDEALAVLNRNNLISYVITNGLLLEKKARPLAEGCNILAVSLDGWDEESQFKRGNVRGSFAIIARGIQSILSHKRDNPFPIVRIATTITKNNFHSLDRIQKMVHQSGVKEWVLANYQFVTKKALESHASFKSATGIGDMILGDQIDNDSYFSPEETAELKRSLRQVQAQAKSLQMRISYNWGTDLDAYYSPAVPSRESKCLLPYNQVSILADGSITLCFGGYKIGHLANDTIQQAWRGDRRRYFEEIYRSRGIIPMCFRCCGTADTLHFDEKEETTDPGQRRRRNRSSTSTT